jgi:hypothetical protein
MRRKAVGLNRSQFSKSQFLNTSKVLSTLHTKTSLAMSNSLSSTTKRSIRFSNDDELCVYHGGAVMDFEEVCKSDIWYQHADMSHMRRNAALVSKEATRYGFGSLLTKTYGKTCPATQDALNTWSRHGNSRRGLERFINSEYSAQRDDTRRRTIQSVLRAQEKIRKENLTEPDLIMKVLSSLSKLFSRKSKNFSRAMGIADELAILNLGEDQARPMPKIVSAPRTKSPRKSPKSPNCVIEVDITNSRCVGRAFKLPFDKEEPFFLEQSV